MNGAFFNSILFVNCPLVEWMCLRMLYIDFRLLLKNVRLYHKNSIKLCITIFVYIFPINYYISHQNLKINIVMRLVGYYQAFL